MNYRVVEKKSQRYIECLPGPTQIETEQDALDLVGICGEHEVDRVMLHADTLSDDFYHLSTGLAGVVLLKFSTYSIKAAAVLTPELVNQGKFQEMVLETNRGNEFRVFYEREQAEDWLTAR